jgi:hypothetical protein
MGLDMYLMDVQGNELGYWRKANAIHGWFIRTLADGRDECQKIKVKRQQLAELRKLCLMVSADKTLAYKLLPPTIGFFFGSYEIDNCYFEDMRETVKIIDNALNSKKRVFIYNASW